MAALSRHKVGSNVMNQLVEVVLPAKDTQHVWVRAGRAMEDGAGMLPDGTRYERVSGEKKGANGYWYRWTRLRGVSASGKVRVVFLIGAL